MKYGKKIVTESFFDGNIKSTKTTYIIPEIVRDRSQVLDEIMKCLNIIDKDKPETMIIRIDLDKKTRSIRLVTKEYELEM